MTARKSLRNAALPAMATGLMCVVGVCATILTWDNSARGIFLSEVMNTVAQAQMTLCVAVEETVWRVTVSARGEQTRKKGTADNTASAATSTVRTTMAVYVEAMGSANVGRAFVMSVGPTNTAAAPWKLLHVWQKTGSCVMVEEFVNVEHVDVPITNSQARPVRTALFVQVYVWSTGSVWSVERLGLEHGKTGAT